MKRSAVFVYVLLAAVSVLPYAVAFKAPYIWDDADELAGNSALRDPRNLPKLFTRSYYDVTRAGPACYRPVKAISMFLTENVLGASPAAQRFSNALIGFGSAALLFEYAGYFMIPSAALAAALLFAAHPVHSEAILCVSFRDDPLSCFFFLAALLLLRRRRQGGALVAYALALFSKESAIVLPAVAWLAELAVPTEKRDSAPRVFYAGSALLAVGFLALRILVILDPAQAVPYPGGSLYANLLSMTPVLLHYLKLLVWPARLSISYVFAVVLAPNPTVLAAAAALISLGVAAAATRDRKIWFFCGWIFLCLTPVMNIFPFLLYSLLFERYLFMPSAGFCLLAAYVLAQLPRRTFAAVAAVLVIAAAWRTGARAADWRSAESLYQKDAERFPQNFSMQVFVARDLLERGDTTAAIAHLRRSLELKPDYDAAHNALGTALHQAGNDAGAVQEFQRAIELNPRYVVAMNNLAAVYFEMHRFDDAFTVSRHAVAVKPSDPASRENLVLFALRQNRLEEALETYRLASADGVHSARLEAYRGMILVRQTRTNEALRAFEAAVLLAPDDAVMHDYLGVARQSAGDLPAAVEEFRTAEKLAPGYAPARKNLALTLLRQGRIAAARLEFDEYLKLCSDPQEKIAARELQKLFN